ncbi:MAG: hypothetical protein H6742_10515 [Alphaproteobacteria bacterium]|nr:hypothetical protein [Alphaproteobacteria bacterium]
MDTPDRNEDEVQDPDVRRVLVLARGADAQRLTRSLHAEGLEAVVVCGEDELGARWVQAADYVVPADSRDPRAVVSGAADAGCDAILPGPGSRWRSARLALLAARSGSLWLGVPRAQLDYVTDRKRVRELADEVGLPNVPGKGPLVDLMEALAWVGSVGLPVMLRGSGEDHAMVRVDTMEELEVAFNGLLESGPVRVERYVLDAREIEVPIVGDGDEGYVAVGTREVVGRIAGARRVFSAPAPGISESLAQDLQKVSFALASILEWRGVGAVQFLVTPDGRPYLLDIRPGLSPGDAATEAAYGVDLIDAALRVGQGQPLHWKPGLATADGFAMQLRLVARPEPGAAWQVGAVQAPAGVELAVASGDTVRPGDVLGDVVLHGDGRAAVLVRAKVALDGLRLDGVPCALPGLSRLVSDPAFWKAPLGRESVAAVVGADAEAPAAG